MIKATNKKATATATNTTATNTTFEDIKTLCNNYIAESLTKSTEATAMLRASVVLYTIKSGYNYGLKDIIKDLPNLSNYGEKTQKNLMRFAKEVRKNKRYADEMTLDAITQWCMQSDTRKFYDNLINPNRKKTSTTPASTTPATIDAVKMFVDDCNLADLKRAYVLISAKLGLTLDESATKAILAIKKIAC